MNQPQQVLPTIDMELVRIRAALPKKLADLSLQDKDTAILLLCDWGNGRKPIRQVYEETLNFLDARTS